MGKWEFSLLSSRRYDPVSFAYSGHPQEPNSVPELWCHILRSSGLHVFQNQQRETSVKQVILFLILIVFCSLGFLCQQSVSHSTVIF